MFGGNKKFMCASCGQKHDPNLACQQNVPAKEPSKNIREEMAQDLNAIKNEVTKDMDKIVPKVPEVQQVINELREKEPQLDELIKRQRIQGESQLAEPIRGYACQICGEPTTMGKVISSAIICADCIENIKGGD